MHTQFETLRPSIERLVAIEADLDELVTQLFRVIASPPTPAANAATTPAVPVLAPATPTAAGAAPIALLPGQVARPPTAAAPTPGQAPAPTTTAATAAAPGAFALHLASYRRIDTAADGWTELLGKTPRALEGLRPGTTQFDGGANGRFYRLNAGPVATRADAEARCRLVQAAGLYCAVIAYAGTAPL